MNPLDGAADPAVAGRRRGMFWIVDTGPAADARMVWHNGATGGYSSFFGLYPDAGRGVAVLADTARPAEQQRIARELAAPR